MTWEQPSLFTDKELGLQGPVAACYFCSGTGLLQSDEECACVDGKCQCKECK